MPDLRLTERVLKEFELVDYGRRFEWTHVGVDSLISAMSVNRANEGILGVGERETEVFPSVGIKRIEIEIVF